MRTYSKDNFDYSQIAGVVVDMKPVDVRPGPLKTTGRRRSSIVSKPPDIFCVACLDIISFSPHIHCTECKQSEVVLCLACFQLGAEMGEHIRGHNYEIAHRCGPPVFKPEPGEGENWGVLEDQRLLSLIRTYKLEDWPKIAYTEFGRARTIEEALNHFSACFMQSVISEIAIEEMVHPPIHAFGFTEPEIYTGEFFKPTPGDELIQQIREICDRIPDGHRLQYEVDYSESPAIRPTKSTDEFLNDQLKNMICEFSHVHVEHNPAVLAELMYGQPKCFLVNRFTYLYKSSKHSPEKTTADNMQALYLEHMNRTPRSRKLSFQQSAELPQQQSAAEEDGSLNVSPTHKVYDDQNVEEEHLTPESNSVLESNGFHEEDDHPPAFFSFPPRIYEYGSSPPPQPPKSPLRNITISTSSPTPPLFMNNTDDSNLNPPVLEIEEQTMVDTEDSNQDSMEHGYHILERFANRRRDTLSCSPPKIRHQSVGRPRRKRKLDSDGMPKMEDSNGFPTLLSNHEFKSAASKLNGCFLNPVEYLTKERALAYRLTSPNLQFVKKDPPYLSKQRVRRFDAEDLNLIAYNPKRDDFEHEYRNAGEHFISKIFLNGECLVFSEVETMKTAIRLAKVQRYNRILERRYCNHAIIREHQLLSEFFSIVKTNVNERGKYTIFAGESFPSRKRAEECRPYFAKMRGVCGSNELLDLAEDIAEIEMLKLRIRQLQAMQMAGQTELKGRLKSEITYTPKGRKRRTRKADGELRKAGLRWERIKRWNKRVNETF